MAAVNDLEQQREKLVQDLAELRRAKEANEGQIAEMKSTIEGFQTRMLGIQQSQEAYHREQVEQRAGTRDDLGIYVRSADDGRLPAQVAGNYLVTDKGAVQLRGHYSEVVAPDDSVVKVWSWGVLDDPDPRSAEQLELQRAVTERSIVRAHQHPTRRFSPACDRRVLAAARALGGRVERIFADSSGIGAEWVPDYTIPELEREVEVPTNFTGLFRRRNIGPGGTLKLPYRTGHLRLYKGAVPTANNPADALLSDWATGASSIDTVKGAVATQVDRDAQEDSIVAITPELIRDILMAIRYAEDDTWIWGDTTATHRHAIASWDGRSMLGGTTGLGTTADHRRRWDGLVERAFNLTSMTTDQDAAETWAGLQVALGKLGVKNMMTAHGAGEPNIIIAPSWEYFFNKMLNFAEFLTFEKVGSLASVLTGTLGPGGMLPGQVGFVQGFIPVCIPFPLSADLAATGLYTGSGSTTGMLVFDRSRFEHCVRRGATLESETNILNDTVTHVTRIRSVGRAQDAVASTVKDVHYSFNLVMD